MLIVKINPISIQDPVGNYSHGAEISGSFRHLFISGQIPEASNGEIPKDFEAQCKLVWHNITEVLKAANMTLANLVKVTTFLTDSAQAEINGEIRREVLGDLSPALTVVVVKTLDSR